MSRISLLALTLIGLGAVGGCGMFAGPAGPLNLQRQNASLHDPYADNDLGPPIVGGRPREFQKPLSEPTRNRWLRDSWWLR